MNSPSPWLWLALSAVFGWFFWLAIRSKKANTGLWPDIRRASRPFLYWCYVALYGVFAIGCFAAAIDSWV